MKRRDLITCIISSSALAGCGSNFGSGTFLLNPFPCGDSMPVGTRVYTARARRFEYMDLQEQTSDELCWAAAIQAVLQYHGRSFSQDEIVAKVRGAYSERGFKSATLKEIIRGIGGPWRAWHVTNGISDTLVADLRAGNPVIMGMRLPSDPIGHVVVVHKVTYAHNYFDNRTYIDQVWYWDPWDGEGFQDAVSGCYVRDQKSFTLHSWGPV